MASSSSSSSRSRAGTAASRGRARTRQQRRDDRRPEVSVRMYRQGLGDCFLLSFPREGDRPLFMLVDCGVLLGTEDQDQRMREVAEDIRRTTKGRVDVLVATHEHWDHLSGFLQAGEVFDRIEVGELWLAWTEDPDHELAAKLREGRERAFAALARAQLRLQAAAPEEAEVLQGVLEFNGPLAAAGGGRRGVSGALDYLLKKARPSRPRYCRPGAEPITLPGVEGVRVYVLGPPENERLIKKSDPTRSGREVYELAARAEVDRSFFLAMGHAEDADGDLDDVDERKAYELSLPFDSVHQIKADAAKDHPFFRRVYFGEADGEATADRDEPSWRRIESDWLGVAHDLALKLDNDTNNTSLALAIELSPGGDVLLFPGDAQVGNWLSWAELVWPKGAKPEEDAAAVTAERLLARTVLYKVGHHASHNATLRAQGLELMTSPKLAAMIPVDEKTAAKRRWAMPFGPLLRRLEERTRGRVIRADRAAGELKDGEKPPRMTDEEWKDFRARIVPDKRDRLYIEYRIPVEAAGGPAPRRTTG